VLIGIGGMMIGNERAAPALLLSALANILPTWMVMRRRNNLEVRLVMGTLAAVQPAITLFLLSGHVWQMDAHMYFFVALASLAVLPPQNLALSLLGAVVVNLILAINHRPGRYLGMS
jgi:methyl-accepting chemotaxis protein